MEIIARFENWKGEESTVRMKRHKAFALAVFYAKLLRYANKGYKITAFMCDDTEVFTNIIQHLPSSCIVSMIKKP